jgi:hypothetical protein
MPTDDDLRARFRALAAEDAAGVPALSRARIDAYRRSLRRRLPRRAWYAAGVAAAAVVTFVMWPRTASMPFDLSGTSWAAPTDFLLDTPGSVLLRTVPSIDAFVDSTPLTAAPSRGDTSGEQP